MKRVQSKFNPLKLTLVYILFKNSVGKSKRTQTVTITDINLLTLFYEIIAVCTEKLTEPINMQITQC
jgi:hypothetical protein